MSKRHHSATVRATREWEDEDTESKPRKPSPFKREYDEEDLEEDWDYRPKEKIRRKTPHRDLDWN